MIRGFARFLPARRYASAGFCDSGVSVRPSVCPDVTLSYAGIVPMCLAERKQDREMSDSPMPLVSGACDSSKKSQGVTSKERAK